MHTPDLEKTANVLGDDSGLCVDEVLMIHRCVRCAKLLAPITSGCSSC